MSKKNPNGLTDQRLLFADNYLSDPDMNGTNAYMDAYPNSSKKAAESGSARLLKDAKVAAYIARQMGDRSDRTKIDADWLLTRFAEEVEADLADLYDEGGALKPVHKWPKIWRQGLVAGIDVHQEYRYKDGSRIPDGVVMKVKLSDRVKRLEMIGKHVDVQAFKDRVEHSGSIDLTGKTEEELKAIINGTG